MENAVSISFFFFQAEDGIRDGHVTGVQTCALPISMTDISSSGRRRSPLGGAAKEPRTKERTRSGKDEGADRRQSAQTAWASPKACAVLADPGAGRADDRDHVAHGRQEA